MATEESSRSLRTQQRAMRDHPDVPGPFHPHQGGEY
jgi:hypothetical protein